MSPFRKFPGLVRAYPSPEILELRIAPAVTALLDLGTIDGTNGTVLSGDDAGFVVNSAGDVNGDGIADFLVTAERADEGGVDRGATYVIFGSASGFPASISLTDLTGSNGFKITGVANDDRAGHSAAGAGDVNNDGFDDIIIGAQNADEGAQNSGAAYVVFGKGTAFAPSFSLSSLNGTNGFKMRGGALSEYVGGSVNAAGDVNGDGYDDVIVGAMNGWSDTCYVYVVFGKSSGFTASMNLSSLNGTNGFKVSETNGSTMTVRAVSAAGDVNGDGFDDIIIGNGTADIFVEDDQRGGACVLFGKGTFASVVSIYDLDGTDGFLLIGGANGDGAGSSVAAAGDLNRDGYDDVVVGAPYAGKEAGAAYVIFGRPSGFPGTSLLSSLNGSNGFKISGTRTYDSVGSDVSALGDFNGDGIDDLIVGSMRGGTSSYLGDHSASYVIYGKTDGFRANIPVTSLNGSTGFEIVGSDEIDMNDRVGLGGDFNGDGINDLMVGSYQVSPGKGGAVVVFGQAAGSLTVAPNGKSATYWDWDGDLVTVTTSAGALDASKFIFSERNLATGGFQLQALDLSSAHDGAQFTGANLTITAKPGKTGGNSFVNVGYLDATGTDLGTVTINGDLGRLAAGATGNTAPAMKALTVQSMGLFGTSTQGTGSSLQTGAILEGALPKLTIKDDLRASFSLLGTNDSKLKAATIGGAIVADGAHLHLYAQAGIGALTVGGDLRVNGATLSVQTDGPIGTFTVNGSILGQASSESIKIEAYGQLTSPVKGLDLAIQALTVRGHVEFMTIRAGTGALSNADASVGAVTVGGDWVASNLKVGTVAGADLRTGTADDELVTRNNARNQPGLFATLGSLTIKGQSLGTPATNDMFGVVAERILKAKVGSRTFSFTASAAEAFFAAPTGPGTGTENPQFDFTLRELGATTPTVVFGDANLKIAASGKTATYVDVDGDLVTVKRTAGAFIIGDFDLVPGLAGGGQLRSLTLSPALSNAPVGVTITAKPGPDGGNGFANVSAIVANGTLVGAVTVTGDLGQFSGGLTVSGKAGTASLSVHSLGTLGVSTGAVSHVSDFVGGLGKLTVSGDVRGATVTTSGLGAKLGIVTIGGTFDGDLISSAGIGNISIGGTFRSGSILVDAGAMGAITVGGDLLSAELAALGQVTFGKPVLAVKSLTVKGSVEDSEINVGNSLNADAGIGAVSIGRAWQASSLTAGGLSGDDGFFGTLDDEKPSGAGVHDVDGHYASIASILIKGQALGTTTAGDHFGIVSEQIGKAQIGKAIYKFYPGPRSQPAGYAAAPTSPGESDLPFDFYLGVGAV